MLGIYNCFSTPEPSVFDNISDGNASLIVMLVMLTISILFLGINSGTKRTKKNESPLLKTQNDAFFPYPNGTDISAENQE